MAKKKVLVPNENNPRTSSAKNMARLKDTMERLGDLGGIIYNRTTKELVGGNHRTKVIMESIDSGEVRPVIEKNYRKATKTGTRALGYVDFEGERFAYREVEWTMEVQQEAMIAANVPASNWDANQLSGDDWDKNRLADWGVNLPEKKKVERGEVEFAEYIGEANNYIVLKFDNEVDWLNAKQHFGLKTVAAKRTNGKEWSRGVGRVVDGGEYLTRLADEG